MDDRETLLIDRLAFLEREYYKNIGPYVKMKASIYNVSIPMIIISSEGVKREYNFTPEQEKAINQIDELIRHIQEQTKAYIDDAYELYGYRGKQLRRKV